MKSSRSRLPSVGVLCLLAAGCASVQRSAAEQDLRNSAISQMAYQLPDSSIWTAVGSLLGEEGYRWTGNPTPNGVLRTHWRCGSSSCDALRITLGPAGLDGRSVTVLRTSHEIGDSIVPQTERAFDVEWSLLRQLDPANASAIATAAQDGARRVVQTE